MKTYFLYRHIRLDTKEVFYIGIGTNLNKYNSNRLNYKRAYSKYKRSSFWHSKAGKYYNVDAMTIYNIIKGKISRKLKGKIFTN